MARFDGGWIKLHRSIALSDIGQNGHCLAILVTILIWASRFPSTVRWKGRAREIPAGSVLVGIRELATHLRFSKDTVYRQLSYLSGRDTIEIETSTRGTLVTIRNWEKYQDTLGSVRQEEAITCDTAKDTNATRTGRQPTLNGELKNVRRKNNTGAALVIHHPLLAIWNSNRGQLPEAKAFSKGRLSAAEARWQENSLEDYWTQVVQRVAASSFCRGEKNNPNGSLANWKAGIDFFLRPDTHLRVMEGFYDDRKSSRSTVGTIADLDLVQP